MTYGLLKVLTQWTRFDLKLIQSEELGYYR